MRQLTHSPPETVGARATELFLFMPYFIHYQSYFHCIWTVISYSRKLKHTHTHAANSAAGIHFIPISRVCNLIMNNNFFFVFFPWLGLSPPPPPSLFSSYLRWWQQLPISSCGFPRFPAANTWILKSSSVANKQQQQQQQDVRACMHAGCLCVKLL